MKITMNPKRIIFLSSSFSAMKPEIALPPVIPM